MFTLDSKSVEELLDRRQSRPQDARVDIVVVDARSRLIMADIAVKTVPSLFFFFLFDNWGRSWWIQRA